jgi:hypothetical protein
MKGWKPKPEDPNSNRWTEAKSFLSENGDEVYLNYNALVTERVIPLDYEDHVEDVICPSHGLCILLYDSRSPIESRGKNEILLEIARQSPIESRSYHEIVFALSGS